MPETHEGGAAYARTPQSELYLRATTMFAGKDSFYENADGSDQRAKELGRELAVSDWGWYAPFTAWLRSDGNIRTMATILAVEGIRARLAAKKIPELTTVVNGRPGFTYRQLTHAVLQRPDEPGKLLQYHFTNNGKSVPKPIKRGVADAVTRMLNQRQALRYDKPGDMVRLGDVIEYVHPVPKNVQQGALFEHLITSRHDREGYEPPVELDEIRARWVLDQFPPDERHAFAKTIASGTASETLWRKALAGSWEWGKLWLGEK
jgi:hypothetical protein